MVGASSSAEESECESDQTGKRCMCSELRGQFWWQVLGAVLGRIKGQFRGQVLPRGKIGGQFGRRFSQGQFRGTRMGGRAVVTCSYSCKRTSKLL